MKKAVVTFPTADLGRRAVLYLLSVAEPFSAEPEVKKTRETVTVKARYSKLIAAICYACSSRESDALERSLIHDAYTSVNGEVKA